MHPTSGYSLTLTEGFPFRGGKLPHKGAHFIQMVWVVAQGSERSINSSSFKGGELMAQSPGDQRATGACATDADSTIGGFEQLGRKGQRRTHRLHEQSPLADVQTDDLYDIIVDATEQYPT
jgi:hypothetical protein